jgi:hypothetical protein
MKSTKPFTTDPLAPPARLADLCELRLGVQIAPPQLKRRGPSLQGMRLVRGRDLFLEVPVGEELLSDAVAHRGDPNLLRLRQGDVLFPMVARRLRARIVDSSLEGCIAHHTIAVVRPRPEALPIERLANILCSREFLEAAERVASARMGGVLRLTVRDRTYPPVRTLTATGRGRGSLRAQPIALEERDDDGQAEGGQGALGASGATAME